MSVSAPRSYSRDQVEDAVERRLERARRAWQVEHQERMNALRARHLAELTALRRELTALRAERSILRRLSDRWFGPLKVQMEDKP